MKKVEPAFLQNNIPVVFAVDNNYAPYLSVCLESLINSSSITNNYDIWILDGGLSADIRYKLQSLIHNKRNFSIRYFDVKAIKEIQKQRLFISNHASVANYYRLFIPKIFSEYSKILYLDCDLLINRDIANLYNIELDNNILGAVVDACTYFDASFWKKYCNEKLKISDSHKYFNSGVLICNINEMKNFHLTKKCLKKLKEFNPVCWDQCLLNAICQNRIKYLDMKWNAQWHWNLKEFEKDSKFISPRFLIDYQQSIQNPYILHFTSQKKPWNRWHAKLAEHWWKIAKQSIFYEDIISKITASAEKQFKEKEMNIQTTRVKTSIIIPVYNVAKYLSQCLDSVIKQTLKDIEIICIDDGSTDGSLEILEQYEQKDKRIQVLVQENSGQGSARNKGLKLAKGKYIQFLDSDDFLEPNCCKRMFDIMEDKQTDVGCFSCHVLYETQQARKNEDMEYFKIKHLGLNLVTSKLALSLDVNCWNKIFRKSFLDENGIYFPEKLHFEDVAFFWYWLSKAKTIYGLNEKLMFYRRREKSFVNNIFEKKSPYMLDSCKVNSLIYDYLKQNNKLKEYSSAFIEYCTNKVDWQLNNIATWNIKQKQKIIDETANLLEKFYSQDITLPNNIQQKVNQLISRNYYAYKCAKTTDEIDVKPYFVQKNVPVVFATDKNYVSALSVALQSLVMNINKENNYDIIILYSQLYDYQKRMLYNIVDRYKNVSLRFVNMDEYIAEYGLDKLLHINHITTAAYYRLLASSIFSNYDKILYLDCDIIITEDIANLYNIDIKDYSIGGCLDFCISNSLDKVIIQNGFEDYIKNTLNIPDTTHYINSGVLIINIKKWKDLNIESYLLQLAQINNRFFHDQNVLNSAFYNDIFIIEPTWNFQYHIKFFAGNYAKEISPKIVSFFDDIEKTPAIIHYTSHIKPWNELHYTYSSLWWEYARRSPFYEIILKNLYNKNQQIVNNYTTDMSIVKDISNYSKNRFNYYRCKLLANLTFGKMRKHYKDKKKKLKAKIKAVKQFLKEK